MALRGQLYREVLDVLRQEITAGQYRERFPAEKDLQQRFGVSATTVKTALAVLVQEQRIVRIPGRGTFVSDRDTSVPEAEVLAHTPTQKERTGAGTIGLILPTLRGVIFTHVLFNILRQCAEYGWNPMIALSGSDKDRERELIRQYRQAGVDGLLVWPAEGEQYNEELVQWYLSGFPIVLIDRWLPGFDIPCVRSDHRLGSRLAAQHLRALGHQYIALVSLGSEDPQHTQSVQERQAGFLEECLLSSAATITPLLWIRPYQPDESTAVHVTWLEERLREHPEVTAAIGVETYDVECLRRATVALDYAIPDRLSVMGFDVGDIESDRQHGWVSYRPSENWTWIDQCEEQIGRTSVDLLKECIEGNRTSEALSRSRILTPIVHTGQTTGPVVGQRSDLASNELYLDVDNG